MYNIQIPPLHLPRLSCLSLPDMRPGCMMLVRVCMCVCVCVYEGFDQKIKFKPSLLNTVVFLVQTAQQVPLCNTRQHTAAHCNTLHHTLHHTLWSSLCRLLNLYLSAAHCNTLQYTATHCNACCNTLCGLPCADFSAGTSLQPATRCNTHRVFFVRTAQQVSHCNIPLHIVTLQHTRWSCLFTLLRR